MAKWLIIVGIVLVVMGLLCLLGLPLGKLPGDIRIKTQKAEINFPLVTSLIVSIVLTVVINVVLYFMRK